MGKQIRVIAQVNFINGKNQINHFDIKLSDNFTKEFVDGKLIIKVHDLFTEQSLEQMKREPKKYLSFIDNPKIFSKTFSISILGWSEFFSEENEAKKLTVLLNSSIRELDFGYLHDQVINALIVLPKSENKRIYTIKQLVLMQRNQIRAYKNVGQKAITAIDKALEKVNLHYNLDKEWVKENS